MEGKEGQGTDTGIQSLASLSHWGDPKLGSVDQVQLPPELPGCRYKNPETLPGRLEAALADTICHP